MHITKLAMVALTGVSLAGCAGDPNRPREGAGTAIGAVTGAVIGSQFGGGPGERLAAGVAGAAIGGLIGNRIGASLDEEDRRRAYAAEMDALERSPSGAPVGWRNPDSGRYGNVVSGPAYDTRARNAATSPTPSISTVARRRSAVPLAAIRTALGRASSLQILWFLVCSSTSS